MAIACNEPGPAGRVFRIVVIKAAASLWNLPDIAVFSTKVARLTNPSTSTFSAYLCYLFKTLEQYAWKGYVKFVTRI